MTKTYEVTMQIGPNYPADPGTKPDLAVLKIKAATEREAWTIASDTIRGVVVDIK